MRGGQAKKIPFRELCKDSFLSVGRKLTKPNVVLRSWNLGDANCLQLSPAAGGASSNKSISIPPLVFDGVVAESRHTCGFRRARPGGGGGENAFAEDTDAKGDAGRGTGVSR